MAGRKRGAATEPPAQGVLAAMQAEDRRQAEAVQVSDETLAEWFFLQRTALQEYIGKLADVFNANLERAERERWPDGDARWETLWMQDARLMYADGTAQLLDRRQHVVVCPLHGVKGVEADIDWAGLASRGLMTGEGALAWTRYCEKCQAPALKGQVAAKLAQWWKKGTGPPWQKGATGPFETTGGER